ncbi:Stk1 family PASTA domain-containing Ser/Thr kinase [Aquihabitans sp. G128]|uniref:Stk1 family PASTA domain-containing Ser/Thr kinase n=1 Tax=Aquihabitans sp. G128 TaxID=2849779 RepID=UPI001C216B73|nr:Stk1 family PASTA domain-containing Ser/Thr kinase [Aquihabitans sp. G128]QXC59729.1 Stk1 family PASTA domain-containing Ser/Thr kinase [Aquihabitans sp. G128]
MSNREQVVLNGRYELQRRVGRGGMAEVFLARDRLLDRPVAIKILFPEFATDPSFVARFRREAQSAANLNHPNIVGVYDWGKERGTYYIVMEYIDGRSVSDILRSDGPIEAKRAAGIAADVAGALGFAHRKGVVHRDVKPGNVLITSNGEVKVADFGIARAMTQSSEENLTQTGSVMGTATYFSPEQAQGKPVDPRSDLYSLGVVLYEMSAGKPPFSADSPVAIAYKHVQEPVPSLREQVPGVPEAYEAITLKALAKQADDRYQDAAELRADLLRFREGRPVQAAAALAAPPPGPPTAATAAVPRAAGVVVPAGPATGATEAARYEEPPPRKRTGWFFAAILLLLVVLGGLLFAFGKQLGVFDSETKQVTVENYVGLTRNEASQKLDNLGLTAEFEVAASDKPKDEVIAQDPESGGSVDEGGTVKLTVSGGAATADIPDLNGFTEAAARSQLVELGFADAKITRREEESDLSAGTVIRSEPGPGTQPVDASIVLVVAIPRATTTTAETTTTLAPTTTTTLPPTTTTTRPPVTTTTSSPPATTSTVAPVTTTTTQ